MPRRTCERQTQADPTRARALSRLSSISWARGDFNNAAFLAEQAWFANAWLEDARELLLRLFTINFESANDENADFWCGLTVQRYGARYEAAHCRLLLMTWGNTQPHPDEAWQLVQETLVNTPAPYRAGYSAQLHVLMAGVLARANHPDSALNVLRKTRARAVADGLKLASSSQAPLLQHEAAVRVLLGEPDTACKLLADYKKRTVGDVSFLASSRRFAGIRSRCQLATS